jgi:hypothetical protein
VVAQRMANFKVADSKIAKMKLTDFKITDFSPVLSRVPVFLPLEGP